MGRQKKIVLTEEGIDRREAGYYSTPDFVAKFIATQMIELKPNGKKVFDPCIGKEELVQEFAHNNKIIDGIDIIDQGNHQYANFQVMDFLHYYGDLKENNLFNSDTQFDYDYIIANPPYNCHESEYIKDNKSVFKKLFPTIGIGNTYSMFISAIVDIAKEGAIIGLITNDSFLNSKSYDTLRNQIIKQCKIRYLLLCPNDLFADQKADIRTCILILEKSPIDKLDYVVFTSDRPLSKQNFKETLEAKTFIRKNIKDLILNHQKDNSEFVIGVSNKILALFDFPRIGDIYKCITGISTGNDQMYISKVQDENYIYPFYKNPGSKKFFVNPDGYLTKDLFEIAVKIPNFMIRNKNYVFKSGITCSSMGVPFSACILPEGSTFGVNANIFCPDVDRLWVLSYLNSSLVTYLVRGVLLRSNMITSGYVSRIPVINISEESKLILSVIAKKAIDDRKADKDIQGYISEIDDIIFKTLNFEEDDIEKIVSFCANIIKRT